MRHPPESRPYAPLEAWSEPDRPIKPIGPIERPIEPDLRAALATLGQQFAEAGAEVESLRRLCAEKDARIAELEAAHTAAMERLRKDVK